MFLGRTESLRGGAGVLECTQCLSVGVGGLKGRLEVSLPMLVVVWGEMNV